MILHSVYGSKTGITQDHATSGADYTVIDACQGRFPDRMVNDLLQEGHMVLLTGSKFYRGPPFSGVCLVDHQKMAQLKQSSGGLASGLNSFIGKANLPA